MPSAKTSRNHDNSKAEAMGTVKEKTSGAGSAKMRRIASQNSNSHARDPGPAPTSAPVQPVAPPPPVASAAPTLPWASFDRRVLHAYTREHGLDNTPCFSDPFHHLVLSNPRSIGPYSPTMVARKRKARRQDKEQLARSVRRHFNGVGVQENDVIVEFILKLQYDATTKQDVFDRQVGVALL